MKEINNINELKKTFQKRNFYTTKDAGWVYIIALLAPLVVGLIFVYATTAIVSGQGVTIPEGTSLFKYLTDQGVWGAIIPYMLLTELVFLVTYFSFNKLYRIKQSSCKVSFKKANVWTVLICVAVGILCVIGFVWLIEGCFGGLFQVLGIKKDPSEVLGLPLDTVGWYFVNLLILGVVPAICEELIFRGMIFQGLKEKFSPVLSMLISSLLFALMHQNIEQFIYPLILGMLLSFVFHRTNNLLYPMIIHLFNNFTTITMSYLANIGVINLNFSITWWFVLVAIAAAGVTVLIWWLIDRFYLRKQQKIEVENEGEVHQTPAVGIGKFPLTLIVGILISVVMIVINIVM